MFALFETYTMLSDSYRWSQENFSNTFYQYLAYSGDAKTQNNTLNTLKWRNKLAQYTRICIPIVLVLHTKTHKIVPPV